MFGYKNFFNNLILNPKIIIPYQFESEVKGLKKL